MVRDGHLLYILAFRLKQLSAAPLQIQTMNQVSNLISKEIMIRYCDVFATNKTGSSSDDCIYSQLVTHSLINYTYAQAIQCYVSFTHFAVHHCTRTRIPSFH
jgi:hypothetical protein